MKHAIIDIGSNTIRLCVYEVTQTGDGAPELNQLFSQKQMAGLVNYVEDGRLSDEGIAIACRILSDFSRLLTELHIQNVHPFATASIRNVSNTKEIVKLIRRETGLSVDVVSGEDEAKLGYVGSMMDFVSSDGAVFDIGGGSTELTYVDQGQITSATSFPVGSLNLFRGNVSRIWPDDAELAQIELETVKVFSGFSEVASGGLQSTSAAESMLRISRPAAVLTGMGGTARAMLKVGNPLLGYPPTNRQLSREDVRAVCEALFARDGQTRKLLLKRCPDRIHTAIPGAVVVKVLMEMTGAQRMNICSHGVREGYLLTRCLG